MLSLPMDWPDPAAKETRHLITKTLILGRRIFKPDGKSPKPKFENLTAFPPPRGQNKMTSISPRPEGKTKIDQRFPPPRGQKQMTSISPSSNGYATWPSIGRVAFAATAVAAPDLSRSPLG